MPISDGVHDPAIAQALKLWLNGELVKTTDHGGEHDERVYQ
jgi:hypothetical protein